MEAYNQETNQRYGLVPDVLMNGVNGFSLAIDVTFLYGECKTYLPKRFSGDPKECLTSLIKAFGQREKGKFDKYKSECDRRETKFDAFIIESHGFTDASVDRVLQAMAGYATRTLGANYESTLGYFKRRIAIAIQRGNARCDGTATRISQNSYGSLVSLGLVVPPSDE